MSISISVQPSWDDMILDSSASADNQELSSPPDYSYSSMLPVFQQEEEDDKMNNLDDYLIMQVDADEGLLNLNDFYDSISADISPPEQLLGDALLAMDSDSDTNSFFSCEELEEQKINHKLKITPPQLTSKEFQETMQKLSTSMQKSQATRRSLYAKTPKLKDYKRSTTVETVVQRIEYSSHQIDSYYSSLRTL